MNADDFRRIAQVWTAHMRALFSAFKTKVEELPEVFAPVAGGWGRMGATHIRLATANEDLLEGALRTAWKLRIEKNAKTGQKKRVAAARVQSAKGRRKKP